MKKRVSVIIPNYNHASFLAQRIDSILKQTMSPFEIIILDDCSTDRSNDIILDYACRYPIIKYVPNRVNSGSTFSQWNKGVTLAKGQLIWMAESDDVADINFLERMVNCFEKNRNVVLAYCQSNLINEKGEVTGSGKVFTDDLDNTFFNTDFVMEGFTYIDKFLIHYNTIPNASAVIFKKNIYSQAGALPVHIKNTGDWLAWLKILCLGKIAFLAEPLNYFRRHSDSVTAIGSKQAEQLSFQDWFGYEVRYAFVHFLKRYKIQLPLNASKLNAHYLSIDKGRIGLNKLQNKRFIRGWALILQASFYPKFQTGFIKKALFGVE